MLDDHLAIDLWEDAAHLAPVDQAVRTLAAVERIDADAAADWPVDERDRALIRIRCETFGPQAEFYVACPACDVALETQFDLGQLLALRSDSAPALAWSGADYEVRAPTSREVAAAVRSADRAGLARACVVGLDETSDGPDVAEVEALLERAFPLLDVSIGFTCSACGEVFSRRFDPATYLWTDIERLAEGLMADIHRLAAAYGWGEQEILRMSRRRRAAYLARLGA
jgi:hypothetical protein